ncbi:hypothetical protein [Mongoliimonas terrestris]|uniref:hypothetical protein n=1 Tax=Mongoliimonas terrestris TaxID=1709001 RepID=UPI00094987B5|nr:hypothetical protein [Mongoliimonas terrestris]
MTAKTVPLTVTILPDGRLVLSTEVGADQKDVAEMLAQASGILHAAVRAAARQEVCAILREQAEATLRGVAELTGAGGASHD